MTIKLFYILILFQCINFFATPTVSITYPALLGNRLFVFSFGRIIAEKLGFNFKCSPIYGFPNTYIYEHNEFSNQYPTQQFTESNTTNAMTALLSSNTPRNIILQGYFQKYVYLEEYTEKIKNDWLRIDPVLKEKYHQNPDDIVLYIRFNNPGVYLPFYFYENALRMATYKQLFICTDEPNHPYLLNFSKYNPIIRSTLSLSSVLDRLNYDEICKLHFDDFLFIASFNKIITSNSTYSWWASFLSDASEIYAADSSIAAHYGKINQTRYHYISI